MTEPSAQVAVPRRPGSRLARHLGLYALVITAAAVGLWFAFGKVLWAEYGKLVRESRLSEDTVPVGYIGLNYRRSYNDRPLHFHGVVEGRKTLFAAKTESGTIDVYDVTDAAFDPQTVQGGFGRDSIPGIDYPIIDPPGGKDGRILRDRQSVFGLNLKEGPRTYPHDLMTKIEVVNDKDGATPIVIVYDRKAQAVVAFERVFGGAATTFGTTGYSCQQQSLLYDRKTKSLWLLQNDNLVCVNGPLKGSVAKPRDKASPTLWGDWKRTHSTTTVLVGNDRAKPIPTE